MKSKAKSQTKRISNRRARHDYELGDSLIVGIQLTGPETRALRLGHGQLQGAYVTIKNDELWLINATVSGGPGLPITETEQTRSRKLLAKHREIEHLMASKQQGQTVVPLEILTSGHFIKLRIAVGRGKKLYDKRQTLKKREEQRRINQAVKNQR